LEGWKIVVPGRPVPKGRPRYGRNGAVYTPKKTREYERKVREIAHKEIGEVLGGRLGVRIKFYLCGGKLPDIDNLIKAAVDGLIVRREPKFGVIGVVEDDVIFEKIEAERILVWEKKDERTEIYIWQRGGEEMAG